METHPVFFHRSFTLPKHIDPHPDLLGNVTGDESSDRVFGIRKILMVDDNADLLEMTRGLFEEQGFEVWTATNGAEAVEILQQEPEIGALFTDVVMPGMSGFQLGYEARALRPHIKIILVSGYPNPATQAGEGDIHDFDFILKPYRIHDVLRLLAKPN